MQRRYGLFLVALSVLASMGAQFRTQNFLVSAATPEIAKQIGQYAENYRREKAILWLGQEMPSWPQPCPLIVQVSMEGPSGATSFQFGQNAILSMKMEIQGPLDRLLASVLPHEITHTVFAYHFRCPVPRWADEGGSVLSEDDIERDRHDKLTRQILNRGQQIPLRRLFSLKDYPREVMCLYAEGFSMVDFLVAQSSRQTFLAFLGMGMQGMNSGGQGNWDQAVQAYYHYRTVDELEEAWLKHLRDTRRQPNQPDVQLAQNQAKMPPTIPASRNMVRLTVPPVQPIEPTPIVRGQSPTGDQVGQFFGQPPPPPPVPPEYRQPAQTSGPNWVPVYPLNAAVQLGTPEYPAAPR